MQIAGSVCVDHVPDSQQLSKLLWVLPRPLFILDVFLAGQSSSLTSDDFEQLCVMLCWDPIPFGDQQQPGNDSWLQSAAPLFPPHAGAAAMLPIKVTPSLAGWRQQADHSSAALAGESPGSAKSACEFFSGQAVTAQGQTQGPQLQGRDYKPCKQQYWRQQGEGQHPEEPYQEALQDVRDTNVYMPAAAEIAAPALNPVESWISSARHAGLQHAASGGFTIQTQPGMYGSGFGHKAATDSSAVVVPGVSSVAL